MQPQTQTENLNESASENKQINDILENTIISEMIQNLDILDNNCRGKIGEDIVEMRIKQLAYSKILFNVQNEI